MKKNLLAFAISLLAITGFVNISQAQLPNDTLAPNWTLKDINGNTYTLWDYTNQGKKVVMDVSAVWCDPCWSYHTSGALEGVYNSYGPSGTVDQSMMVFFIEGDQSNLACLQGLTSTCDNSSGTQGNWTSGVNFPMFLTCAAPTGNGATVVSDYNIAYFPTVYTVCPDRTIYESGQRTAAQHYAFANSTCAPLTTTVNDVKAFSITSPNFLYCVGTVSPVLTIQNYGTGNLTSCNIIITLDGNTIQTIPWTGNLSMYDASVINLNQLTGISHGTHTISAIISDPNGTTDENNTNNTYTKTFNVMITPSTIPINQDFSASSFPPDGYNAVDVSHDGDNWVRSSASGHTAVGSMYIDFFNIMQYEIDDFILPLVDFTGFSNPTLTFWLAHRRYSTSYSDKLEVDVSSSCGTTWTQKWMKSGANLATSTTLSTSEYVPSSSDWRQETVDLSAYQNMSNLMIRFRATSGYGNDAYVDDINITNVSGMDGNMMSQISIFPNPSAGELYVTNAVNSKLEVVDLLGQVIFTKDITSSRELLDLSSLTNGSYIVRITNDNNTITRNIVLSR